MIKIAYYLEKFLEILTVEKNLAKNSLIAYQTDLEDFVRFIQENNHNITNIEIFNLYINELNNRDLQQNSYLRKLSALRNFTKFLVTENIIADNPLKILKLPKKKQILPKFLTKEDILILFSYLYHDTSISALRNLTMLEIIYATGLRVSELVSLKLSSLRFIDKKSCNITEKIFVDGKGGKERMVLLNNHALTRLKQYLLHYQNDLFTKNNQWLFPSNSNAGHITRQRFAQILKELALNVGIDPQNISPHIIRHSFATHLLDNGLDLRSIQELLGHANLSTTEIYTHLATQKLTNVINKYHPLSKRKNSKDNY